MASSIAIIVLSVVICVYVSQYIAKQEMITLLEDEMEGFLTQADSLTESIGGFWEADAFDKERPVGGTERSFCHGLSGDSTL